MSVTVAMSVTVGLWACTYRHDRAKNRSCPIPMYYFLQTLTSVWTAMGGALTSASTHTVPTSAPAPVE